MRRARRLGPLLALSLTLLLGAGCSDLYLSRTGASTAQADAGTTVPGGQEQGSGLKGGEVDDNAQFEAFLSYLATYTGGGVESLDVSERYQLWLLDPASKSVPNATVTFLAGEDEVFSARSASNGRVLFFPKAAPLAAQATDSFSVRFEKGAQRFTRTLPRDGGKDVVIAWPEARAPITPKVDLCFTLDVTGSMGDELSRIQSTIGDIAARIKSLPDAPALRYGLVAYRDHGDDFVTREFDFTGDLDTFKTRLNSLAAVGGGGYPEAVSEALGASLDSLSWDASESVRLMFLVGDAPPNLPTPQTMPYSSQLFKAARQGVKIYPLAASGLDARGQYVFRQLAQFTGGKFLFLTYGGQTSHDVGPVQENNLDDLVVGIVKAELADLK